jgi:hypothetical protein
MPLHWTIDPDRRRVTATLLKTTTEQEVYDFLGEVIAAGAMPYAKLVDAAAATKWITSDRVGPLAATAQLYSRMRLGPIGPLAIVATTAQAGKRAEEYAALADAARLVRIFDSRDKAEAWLSSQEIRPA